MVIRQSTLDQAAFIRDVVEHMTTHYIHPTADPEAVTKFQEVLTKNLAGRAAACESDEGSRGLVVFSSDYGAVSGMGPLGDAIHQSNVRTVFPMGKWSAYLDSSAGKFRDMDPDDTLIIARPMDAGVARDAGLEAYDRALEKSREWVRSWEEEPAQGQPIHQADGRLTRAKALADTVRENFEKTAKEEAGAVQAQPVPEQASQRYGFADNFQRDREYARRYGPSVER